MWYFISALDIYNAPIRYFMSHSVHHLTAVFRLLQS